MSLVDPFAPPAPVVAAPAPQAAPEPPAEDPWASAPPVAQIQPATPEAAAGLKVNVTPNVMKPTFNEIVTTFKAGTGYDQPWVVLHAATVEESDALLDQKFAEYLAKVKRVATFFNGNDGSAAPAAGRAPANGQPQGAVDAPAWAPPKPEHDFVYKTGVSAKNGKTWHAWMPPQKGDARQAKFFYQN